MPQTRRSARAIVDLRCLCERWTALVLQQQSARGRIARHATGLRSHVGSLDANGLRLVSNRPSNALKHPELSLKRPVCAVGPCGGRRPHAGQPISFRSGLRLFALRRRRRPTKRPTMRRRRRRQRRLSARPERADAATNCTPQRIRSSESLQRWSKAICAPRARSLCSPRFATRRTGSAT